VGSQLAPRGPDEGLSTARSVPGARDRQLAARDLAARLDELRPPSRRNGGLLVRREAAGLLSEALGKVVDLATGTLTSCAITEDGRVGCWNTELAVTWVAGLTQATRIETAGFDGFCVLDHEGKVTCWGSSPWTHGDGERFLADAAVFNGSGTGSKPPGSVLASLRPQPCANRVARPGVWGRRLRRTNVRRLQRRRVLLERTLQGGAPAPVRCACVSVGDATRDVADRALPPSHLASIMGSIHTVGVCRTDITFNLFQQTAADVGLKRRSNEGMDVSPDGMPVS